MEEGTLIKLRKIEIQSLVSTALVGHRLYSDFTCAARILQWEGLKTVALPGAGGFAPQGTQLGGGGVPGVAPSRQRNYAVFA